MKSQKTEYKFKIQSIRELREKIRSSRHNEVKKFLANKLCDDMHEIQEENIQKLFSACAAVEIEIIFIGTNELVQSKGPRYQGWPAVWHVTKELSGARSANASSHNGFGAGCGNSNQSQVTFTVNWFPAKYIGKAWHVETQEIHDRLGDFVDDMCMSRELQALFRRSPQTE